MVGAHIQRTEVLSATGANVLDLQMDGEALGRVQDEGWTLHLFAHNLFQVCIRAGSRCSVDVLPVSINRSSVVAVKPRSVRTDRDEVGQRELIVIPVVIEHMWERSFILVSW